MAAVRPQFLESNSILNYITGRMDRRNMKYSKLMKERIRRVRVLFKELGYELFEGERQEDTYTASFEIADSFQGGFYIDSDNKFLEVAYTFSFSPKMGMMIQKNLPEMLKVCYEYGCYINVQTESEEIAFSVFSKVYFAGLNYYSLRETLKDYQECIESLRELIEHLQRKEGLRP